MKIIDRMQYAFYIDLIERIEYFDQFIFNKTLYVITVPMFINALKKMYGLWRIFLRIYSSILEQNGHHFADHILSAFVWMNKGCCVFIRISL